MAQAAVVILAHNNPQHVRRLIAALGGLDIFLHCDRRTRDDMFAEMLVGAPKELRLVPRVETKLSSWSLVEAELVALREVLAHSSAEHVIIASGSCYPLVSVDDLLEGFSAWRGRSRIEHIALPRWEWSRPGREDDGGLWRMRRRFVTFRGHVVFVRGVPLRSFRQTIPPELRLYSANGWKIYARAHAEALLSVLDERPDLVRFWRRTFIPSESCVTSILSSPELVGEIAETIIHDPVWYIDWDWGLPEEVPVWHPRWLGVEDFDRLAAVRRAPPRPVGVDGDEDAYRRLFARKLTPREPRLVELIDEQLRV